MAIVTLALCAALPVLALAPTGAWLFGALLLFGGSIGSMDVSMNIQGVAVEKGYRRPILTSFHGMFSLGGLFGALLGGLAAALGVMVGADFGAVAVAAAILGLFAFSALLPSDADAEGAVPSPCRRAC